MSFQELFEEPTGVIFQFLKLHFLPLLLSLDGLPVAIGVISATRNGSKWTIGWLKHSKDVLMKYLQ